MTFAPATQFPAQGPWTSIMIRTSAGQAVPWLPLNTDPEKHPE